ncbi:MutG family lantibiotic protection ABC superfamily ATP binding cassette transporter permease, partial [human gut metagenome]
RVTSAWSQLSNQFDTSSDIGKAWSLLPTAAIKNGAGTNLIIASEIIGGIALIVLVAWVITCGVKTMKGAIR